MSEMLKLGLRMVEEDEASDEVIALFDSYKRAFQAHRIPNYIKANAISPASLQLYLSMLNSFYENVTLPQSLISMICFTVATEANCVYCSAIHEVTCRTLGVNEQTLKALAENLEDVSPERIRVIIEFALKTSSDAQNLVPEDYERLRRFGISNDEIVQIVMVASMAAFSDILANSIKIEVDSHFTKALRK